MIRLARRPLLLAATTLLAAPARAQAWPSRPVRLIVPFGLGGSADIAARFLAEPLAQAFGQPFVVENRPGGGGTIGADAVAKAPPDGHTLLVMSNTHTANETLLPNRPYVLLRDLAPVAFSIIAHHVLVVHPSVPARTLAEFLAYARAHPGRVDYASSGPGTPYHIAAEVFRARAGIDINHIPFRGSSQAIPELLAGRIPMIFDIAASALPYVRSGELRALAISTRERSPLAPAIPTFAEQGIADYEPYTWHMVMVRSGTPPAVVRAINAAVNAALAQPAVRERLVGLAMEVVGDSTPESAAEYLRREIGVWEPLVRAAGIRAS